MAGVSQYQRHSEMQSVGWASGESLVLIPSFHCPTHQLSLAASDEEDHVAIDMTGAHPGLSAHSRTFLLTTPPGSCALYMHHISPWFVSLLLGLSPHLLAAPQLQGAMEAWEGPRR